MANNRLWLIHRPSGESICLGKRMAIGWYLTAPDDFGSRLMAFHRTCEKYYLETEGPGSQDDFVLAMEDAEGAPCVTDDFTYEHDGSRLIPRLAPLISTTPEPPQRAG